MSSNIRVIKVCEYCKKEFEARKTTSRTCSDHCAKMLYKLKKRNEKVYEAVKQTEQIKFKALEGLTGREFLLVRDVAKLLNCSRQTIYDLINRGVLKAVNLKQKKTIIRRSDIDKLFD